MPEVTTRAEKGWMRAEKAGILQMDSEEKRLSGITVGQHKEGEKKQN